MEERGFLVGRILARSWRVDVPVHAIPAHRLAEVVPFMLRTGAGSLAWRRAPTDPELLNAYRCHSLQAAVHQRNLIELLRRLAWVGIQPLLCKGWTCARLYPEAGLRPYGDFDLCVPADQSGAATQVLNHANGRFGQVDLHTSLVDLEDRPGTEVLARCKIAKVGDQTVHVLGAEDHLHQLCLHFARHGGWRPLWLCDIAAAAENLPADFDWDYFLAGRNTAWTLCMMGLARRLLDAEIPERAQGPTPAWVERAVLRQWGRGLAGDSHSLPTQPWAQCLRRPSTWLRGIRDRWPNPIEAALALKAGPSTHWPECALQLRYFTRRSAGFVQRCRTAENPREKPRSFEVHQSEPAMTLASW